MKNIFDITDDRPKLSGVELKFTRGRSVDDYEAILHADRVVSHDGQVLKDRYAIPGGWVVEGWPEAATIMEWPSGKIVGGPDPDAAVSKRIDFIRKCAGSQHG